MQKLIPDRHGRFHFRIPDKHLNFLSFAALHGVDRLPGNRPALATPSGRPATRGLPAELAARAFRQKEPP